MIARVITGVLTIRGLAVISRLIGCGFGALWLGWAMKAFAGPDVPVWPAYAATALTAVVSIWRLDERSSPGPSPPRKRLAPPVYLAIVAGEILALNAMVYGLQAYNKLSYLHPAIGLIIGLHFFPLARLFGIPTMHLLGAVMVMAALTAIGLASIGFPLSAAIGIDALVNGLSLLVIAVLPRGTTEARSHTAEQ